MILSDDYLTGCSISEIIPFNKGVISRNQEGVFTMFLKKIQFLMLILGSISLHTGIFNQASFAQNETELQKLDSANHNLIASIQQKGYKAQVYTSEYSTVVLVPVNNNSKSLERTLKPLAWQIPEALLINLCESNFFSRLYAQFKESRTERSLASAISLSLFLINSKMLRKYLPSSPTRGTRSGTAAEANTQGSIFAAPLRHLPKFDYRRFFLDFLSYPSLVIELPLFFDENRARAFELNQSVHQMDSEIKDTSRTVIVLIRSEELRTLKSQLRQLGYRLSLPEKRAL
jgi:hypothetical protein